MRDDKILQLNASNAKNVASLYRQLIRMDARQQAIESVLSRRWSFLGALFSPKWFWHSVNSLHQVLLNNHDEQIKKAMEAEEAERKKPKLSIVGTNGAIH